MGLFNRDNHARDRSGDDRPQPTREQTRYQREQERAAARLERRDGLAAEFDRIQQEKGGGR